VSGEKGERVRAPFAHSPKKYVRRASRELAMPQMTVWKVLRKRLQMRPYRLQLLQALRHADHAVRAHFCIDMLQAMTDEDFLSRLIFSDESSFHLSGKVNRHNVRIWGSENPHETLKHERDSPKVNYSAQYPYGKFMGRSFSPEKNC
jgi:hypothetical protein